MLLNATLWLIVTHPFKINEPKLADWSKWICITFWICFCSLLTSNCDPNAGGFHYSFINFTNLHNLSSSVRILMTLKQIFELESVPFVHFHDILKRLVAKVWFDVSVLCLSLFVRFLLILAIYAVEHSFVVYCHAYNWD